eukprot:TRINITY_DN27416_c0_g1_i1.p1 TRINITY_DN27416_c0_g1~~TRINITY_DN27416_c0_g1_i1.p1  ORF type:complete len:160 (-),score=49.72 TRINITY_DN27416_c0_g1_i1:162-641(-)
MSITQDVPITLLSAQQLAHYVEPTLPDPDVMILLPKLRSIRTVVDKMKNMNDSVRIMANMHGELQLKLETDIVSVAAFYRGLGHPTIEGGQQPSPDAQVEVAVRVNQLMRVLAAEKVNPNTVIMCVVEHRAIVFHALQNDSMDNLYLTYYMPILNTSSD